MDTLSELPDEETLLDFYPELLTIIIEFIGDKPLARSHSVSKRWLKVFGSDKVWRKRLMRRFKLPIDACIEFVEMYGYGEKGKCANFTSRHIYSLSHILHYFHHECSTSDIINEVLYVHPPFANPIKLRDHKGGLPASKIIYHCEVKSGWLFTKEYWCNVVYKKDLSKRKEDEVIRNFAEETKALESRYYIQSKRHYPMRVVRNLTRWGIVKGSC